LSMHVSIVEQVSIDQPAGVRARYQQLITKSGSAIDAQHEVMDCLAEMIWQAQRTHAAYDAEAYLQCLDAKLGKAQ